jgi:hypothetical protein
MARRTIALPPIPEGPDRPVILVRVYPGYHEQAVELFQVDAEDLAAHGYVPVAQSYAEGRYAGWYVTLAAFLVIFLIGIVVLVYMAATRPPGNLAVTYMLRTAIQ